MPGMGQPPMGGGGGVGPAAHPAPMPGNQMQGVEKVMTGLKMLQEALQSIPLGSQLHNEILTAVGKIGKHLPQGGTGGDPQAAIQQLALAARSARAEPTQAAALQGLMGGGGAPPPPMPPDGGAPMGA